MPEYFDIHSHLYFPDFDADRNEAIERLRATNTWTITVGTELATSKQAVELCNNYEGLFATVGVHPGEKHVEDFREEDYLELLKHPKVVAIGECGLDYAGLAGLPADQSHVAVEKARQKKEFEAQIETAVKFGKPIMIHSRDSRRGALDAQRDILDILESKKREHGEKFWGNAHFFSGTTEIAKRYLDIGFSMSFTGVITFVPDYDEAVRYVPADMIMAETDAPFVAPVPYRGKRNEPVYVQEVVAKMAEVRNMALQELKNTLVANALRVFRIK